MAQGVYEFETELNGRAYTGSSANIENRRKQHLSMLRRGCHHSSRFQSAWDLYGQEAFTFRILEVIEDLDERLVAEQKRLDERFAAGTSYNTARDVVAPMLGCIPTEEHRHKLSAALMGNKRAVGYKHTEQSKAKMRIVQQAIGRFPERRQKNAMARAKSYPAFIHRDTGEIIPAGRNLNRLCRERGFDQSCMQRVKSGKRPHYKGWILLDTA